MAQPKSKHLDHWAEPLRKVRSAPTGVRTVNRPFLHQPPPAIDRIATPPSQPPPRFAGKTVLPASMVAPLGLGVAAVAGMVPTWFVIPAIGGLVALGPVSVASWALDNDTPW